MFQILKRQVDREKCRKRFLKEFLIRKSIYQETYPIYTISQILKKRETSVNRFQKNSIFQ